MAQLLHVDDISVTFDGFKAINGLSFDIGRAELRAIIGPNGAGKTTFMDIVTGKPALMPAMSAGGIKGYRCCASRNHKLRSWG